MKSTIDQVDRDEDGDYDENMSTSSRSSRNDHSNSVGKDSDEEAPVIGQRENTAVRYSKCVVIVVLSVVAAVLSTTTFLFTTNVAKKGFANEFRSHAKEITLVANERAENMFGQLKAFSTMVTSYAISFNSTWPNVSIPNFDVRAGDIVELASLLLVTYNPVVTLKHEKEFEAYAATQLEARGIDKNYNTTIKLYDNHTDLTPYNNNRRLVEDKSVKTIDDKVFIPAWQYSNVLGTSGIFMMDLSSIPDMAVVLNNALHHKRSVMSPEFRTNVTNFFAEFQAHPEQQKTAAEKSEKWLSFGMVAQPIFYSLDTTNSTITGFLTGVFTYKELLSNILLDGNNGYYVDIADNCGTHFSAMINGQSVEILYSNGREISNRDLSFSAYLTDERSDYHEDVGCRYSLTIYPTADLENSYYDDKPKLYTVAVLLIFCFTIVVFFVYDRMVHVRQTKVLTAAIRSTAVVSSLFPKQVQNRLMNESNGLNAAKQPAKKGVFIKDDNMDYNDSNGAPIADLFPEATVMFADIVGFTAWSSTREPTQVFRLLETVYSEFDIIAKYRRIFKVETVGDCYVAAAGVPEPCRNHAVMMSRFANDCLHKMTQLTKKLEVELGPDTGDLSLRIGIHSGPVTAGVLRGDRARFQLFGDTVNTAARMETTGSGNQIHTSQQTADLLIAAGKSHWLKTRQAPVYAKGKGEMQTYWIEIKSQESQTEKSSGQDSDNSGEHTSTIEQVNDKMKKETETMEKQRRLVEWNSDILLRFINDIIKRREAMKSHSDSEATLLAAEESYSNKNGIVFDEFKDIINLPKFTSDMTTKISKEKESTATVSDAVNKQLHSYVSTIAELYRHNAFHNFEHASHVTMSCVKLLSRIAAPDMKDGDEYDCVYKRLHDYTYGITSDPLTQFAVVFSGLIHDVDHTGVPNMQLIKEQASIAAVYQNKSVAEQNSIDIAWNLLMEKDYRDLRRAIYCSKKELLRFRQLLVNIVLATDIMDKDLKELRNQRWNTAFAEEVVDNLHQDRRATIVIEHLIQASDVAHTMQHWHIYRKWNARLFQEMYTAYLQGRAEKNPADFWYEGEMGFFDFYIIPLAMKLRSCGVFGVSSDEYLNYAQQNRQEWERKGKQVVAELIETLPSPHNATSDYCWHV